MKTLTKKLSLCIGLMLALLLTAGSVAYAQKGDGSKLLIKGIVTDPSGVPLPGVVVMVQGTETGTTTNLDGAFSFYVPASTKSVLCTYLGFGDVTAAIVAGEDLEIVMTESDSMLEETVVVGYGVQKKISVTGAVTTANITDVAKVSTPSLSNAIAGQLPGIISRQSSGEPGYDAAQIFIRGLATWGDTNPLILIDGVERDLNQITTQEVESFTILKDASATAVYGARGANGVILITTKRGDVGKPTVTFRSETAMMTALRRPVYINGYEYASLWNEALEYQGQDPRWTAEELEKFRTGSDPYLYPNVDWSGAVLKKNTWQTIENLSVTGGTDIIKYYLNIGYTFQDGLYVTDPSNKYNTNANMNRYNFRNNVDVKLSKSLTLSLGLGAIMQTGNHPAASTGTIFGALNTISPIEYPIFNPDGTLGGEQTYVGLNPYGITTQCGYSVYNNTTIQASASLNWDLSSVIEGFSLRALFSYDRDANNTNTRTKYFLVKRYLGKDEDGEDIYSPTYRDEVPLTYGQSSSGDRAQYLEIQANYDRTFGKHNITGMLLGNQREYVALTASDSRSNIPYRRLGLAARLTYNYDKRYLVEYNCGYNGSENFAPGHRFGFFPSASLGWVISQEPWFYNKDINNLKLRGSYGIVGNDSMSVRFAYLNTIKTNGQYYCFGLNQTTYGGMEESSMGNEELTWEKAHKLDIGFDLGMWEDRLVFQVDYFYERRTNILQQRGTIPSTTGIFPWCVPYGNLGEVHNHGFDGMLEIRNTTPSGFFYSLRANATFARNIVIENDEAPKAYPYLSGKGQRLGQSFGFVSLGYFTDEEDIATSPKQTFGNVRPGDIKYQDINGDGVIDSYDQVPIGNPRNPELSFGFGGTIGYKGFDLSLFFNGAAITSFYLAGIGFWPYVDGLGTNNVLREYYDNRWTPETPNAKYPAIYVGKSTNNYNVSNHWMKNGNYLRLRNAEIGYTFPNKFIDKVNLGSLRAFINGNNLLTFDQIKIVDPESNDGTGAYPLQRSINVGVQINFK